MTERDALSMLTDSLDQSYALAEHSWFATSLNAEPKPLTQALLRAAWERELSSSAIGPRYLVGASMETINDEATMRPLFDDYYTVERIRVLFKLFPYLNDARPPTDPELAGLARRMFGPGGWREEAACKRADIKRAKEWLEQRSPEAGFIIRANVTVGLPLRSLESYIRTEFGRTVSYETIRRWREDGLTLMSDFLCGRAR